MTKRRVLIVDDEQIIADTLRLIFDRRGFDCSVAYTVDHGIECARRVQPQLLVSDLCMPGFGGLVMAAVIAYEVPGCRILLLTGDYHSLEEVAASGGRLLGRHAVLTKPIHPEMLLQEADHLLQLSC